jgi:DUF2075 family protein
MAYRKIYIAIDCKDNEEAARMQKAAEDLSASFGMSATDILKVYPYIKKNARLIRNSMNTLIQRGCKGMGSIAADMIANFKR